MTSGITEVGEMKKERTCDDAIKLRPITKDDESFLFQLFENHHPEFMDIVNLDEGERTNLIRRQFDCEEKQYLSEYPNAQFDLILLADKPVGRLYIQRKPDMLHVLSIALLSEYRGKRIGKKIFNDIFIEALESNKTVYLKVLWFNYRALSFYTKLGFVNIGNDGVSYEMAWNFIECQSDQ